MSLTESELEALVARAAEEGGRRGVHDAFLTLGIDTEKPIEAQKDFAHLHKSRIYSERMATFSLAALITAIISGAMTVAWAGYNALVNGKVPPPHTG